LAKLDWTLGFQCITGDQSPGFCAPVIYFSGFSAALKKQTQKICGLRLPRNARWREA
jgi:hypothetical protein